MIGRFARVAVLAVVPLLAVACTTTRTVEKAATFDGAAPSLATAHPAGLKTQVTFQDASGAPLQGSWAEDFGRILSDALDKAGVGGVRQAASAGIAPDTLVFEFTRPGEAITEVRADIGSNLGRSLIPIYGAFSSRKYELVVRYDVVARLERAGAAAWERRFSVDRVEPIEVYRQNPEWLADLQEANLRQYERSQMEVIEQTLQDLAGAGRRT